MPFAAGAHKLARPSGGFRSPGKVSRVELNCRAESSGHAVLAPSTFDNAPLQSAPPLAHLPGGFRFGGRKHTSPATLVREALTNLFAADILALIQPSSVGIPSLEIFAGQGEMINVSGFK